MTTSIAAAAACGIQENTTASQAGQTSLVTFSRNLDLADLRRFFAPMAEACGIDPDQDFVQDGQWHDVQPIEPGDRQKVRAAVGWRESRFGVHYPVASFFTFRHAGHTEVYNGFPDVLDLHRLHDGGHPRRTAPGTSSRRSQRPVSRPPDYGRRRQQNRAVWNASLALPNPVADAARAYLRHRGLGELVDQDDLPGTLRYCPTLAYWHRPNDQPRAVRIGHFPALVAAIQALDGAVTAIHRTYLRPDGYGKADVPGAAKKVTPPSRPHGTRGGAIRLYPAGWRLAVAEGIETSLAVRIATGLPVWSTVSAVGLAAFEPPPGVADVLICADRDASGTGEDAARQLAVRLYRRGIHARVALPPAAGDWLDTLNAAEGVA